MNEFMNSHSRLLKKEFDEHSQSLIIELTEIFDKTKSIKDTDLELELSNNFLANLNDVYKYFSSQNDERRKEIAKNQLETCLENFCKEFEEFLKTNTVNTEDFENFTSVLKNKSKKQIEDIFVDEEKEFLAPLLLKVSQNFQIIKFLKA